MKKMSAPNAHDSVHILLVDDNNHGLVARKAVLEELGYKIKTATSGEEAFELFSKETFNLVITDYKMQKMNGVELIRNIRNSRPLARVILLSGFVEPLGLDEQNTGADVVISKSRGEVSNLIRSVTKLLEGPPAKKPPNSDRRSPQFKAKSS